MARTRQRQRGRTSLLVAACALVTMVLPMIVALLTKAPTGTQPAGALVSLYAKAAGQVMTMPLEDYIVGVVATEMPASFELEALKAQAVAARTYTMRKLAEAEADPSARAGADHRGAQICSDPGCCQAWRSREELAGAWGAAHYVGNIVKIVQAVQATRGLVLCYGGELIDAVYHSCCGGATEDAAEVWGRHVPYLVPTECACAAQGFAQVERRSVLRADLVAVLGSALAGGTVPALSRGVSVSSTTATNRAKTLSVFGVSVKATDLRKALSLRSTALSVSTGGDLVDFSTIGYGHGVGMCQWGTRAYAIRGWTFDRILAHYYRGAVLRHVSSSQVGQ